MNFNASMSGNAGKMQKKQKSKDGGNYPIAYDMDTTYEKFPPSYGERRYDEQFVPEYEPKYPKTSYDSPMPPPPGVANFQYGGNYPPPGPNLPPPNPNTGGEFLVNPLVNVAALSYGQHLMGTGKEYVDKELEKYVPVSKLKYYFAVDTNYVYKKLGLIFFPFAHKDWSVKYASNEPVQPRYEVNAPDLYIPTMAYLTYVLVAGLALGTQNRFTPEILGIQASSALACTILEILVHLFSLYVAAISTSLTTIDILAFCGYKFVGIIFAVLASLIFYRFGYYISLLYFSISLSFFLIRTLKVKILPLNATPGDPYSIQTQHTVGDKRRLYLLLFIAGVQPFLMWWMSYHLVPAPTSIAAAS